MAWVSPTHPARIVGFVPGSVFLVRSAEERDAEVLLENLARLLEEPFNVTTPEEGAVFTVEQERKWIAGHREKPGWLALVPEVDGQVVGMLNFENGPRRRIAHRGLFGMHVVREWRGIGSQARN